MKKIFALFLSTFLFASLFAQQSVTTFLGIPVEGTKLSMRQKLINKGFRYVPSRDCLEGEFNGRDVLLYIVTNRDKVYRIAVFDKDYIDETDIRIRFNNLYRQFMNNEKYILDPMGEVGELPEDEDIAYNISIKNKQYARRFYQKEWGDTLCFKSALETSGFNFEEYLELSDDEKNEFIQKSSNDVFNLTMSTLKCIKDKSVWFVIKKAEYGDKFRIIIYYDNERNAAQGEDL